MNEPDVIAALVVAFASTCGFALSTSLQHRSAGLTARRHGADPGTAESRCRA